MTNGIGPSWFPSWLRKYLTKLGSFFFEEAAWEKHDEGYSVADPSRSTCDRKFLQAMLRDASKTTTTLRVLLCTLIAWFFWCCVRMFGRPSYNEPMDLFEYVLLALTAMLSALLIITFFLL